MHIEFIAKDRVITSRWTGGQTREYAIYPKEAVYANRNFDFRISSATIEAIPSEFTKFEGYHRYLAMLDGPLQLTINGIDKQYKNHELFAFKSIDSITSYTQGTDFNLMLHKRIIDEVVEVRNHPFKTHQPFILLFALEVGSAVINGDLWDLQPWDAILIKNEQKITVEVLLEQQTIVGYWSMPDSK
ncbi:MULTISPECIES: HutD family protein [unclassified Myroides]|uniref:HutD family protein n=1 Tax=unclassified Myroides TaxID=2642485 RepID=UPI003D2F61CD